MIHLTLTGYYAGVPICGINKQVAREQGDDFCHAVYFNFDNPELLELCCKKCLKIWESVDDEDEQAL